MGTRAEPREPLPARPAPRRQPGNGRSSATRARRGAAPGSDDRSDVDTASAWPTEWVLAGSEGSGVGVAATHAQKIHACALLARKQENGERPLPALRMSGKQ